MNGEPWYDSNFARANALQLIALVTGVRYQRLDWILSSRGHRDLIPYTQELEG